MKKNVWITLGLCILFGLAAQFIYTRWDLTADQRYSFSEDTLELLDNIENPVEITVYLEGDLTGNFKVLRNETRFLLSELERENSNIQYKFVNPLEASEPLDSLFTKGIQDISVPTEDKILRVFPYALLTTNGKSTALPLLSNKKIPVNERALASLETLESKLIRELYRLTQLNRKNIGLIVHHDELMPQYLDGFMRLASKEYNIEPYLRPVYDSLRSFNYQDLDSLQKYDALFIAKPINAFTEKDKQVLDQYTMRGGNTIWMVENVDAEMDSLFRSEKIVTFPRELNLTDLFFAYGIRITPAVIQDLQSSYITLAIGEVGNNTAYQPYPWVYFPLSISMENHPINKKINNPIKFEFANPIEILEREGISPTVLLTTSPNVQLQKPLTYIDFSAVEQAQPENFPPQPGVYPMAVLVEGEIPSAYAQRFEAKEIPNFVEKTNKGKMIFISDGDFAKNHLFRGEPLPLGADKYSMNPQVKAAPTSIYSNGEFLLNCLDYLTQENALMALNNKERTLYLMDKSIIKADKNTWRWYNLLFPLIFLGILAGLWQWFRRAKYVK